MKLLNKHQLITALLPAILLLPGYYSFSQSADKGSLSININYFDVNNKIPYLMVNVKTKVNGRFQNVDGVTLGLYLDKNDAANLIGNVITNEKGNAWSMIPASLKNQWGTASKHTFLAAFAGNAKYDSTSTTQIISEAKILIDTASGRSVVATVLEKKDTAWTPVKGVDVVIAIKRMGGDLNVNSDSPTFTTDSTGKASADFKRDSIPGGATGNIILVAKVLDNDTYGNLSIQKTVPWGAKFIPKNNFDKRALFATRAKAPIWLSFTGTAIIVVVWGILIMLVVNIFRIKKLGQEGA